MRSSYHKIISETNLEFYIFLVDYKFFNLMEDKKLSKKELKNIFKEFEESNEDIKKLNPYLRELLCELCIIDYTSTSKYNYNNILGRKKHLFHVVFPSI